MVAVGRGERGIEKWKKAGYWKGELYFETEDAKVSEALSLTQTGNVLGLFDHKVRVATHVPCLRGKTCKRAETLSIRSSSCRC